MDLFDKAKDLVAEHDKEVDEADPDKVADVVEQKVGEKHSGQVADAADKAKGFVESSTRSPPAGGMRVRLCCHVHRVDVSP